MTNAPRIFSGIKSYPKDLRDQVDPDHHEHTDNSCDIQSQKTKN